MKVGDARSPMVAAIIITYHPDVDSLHRLIEALASESVFTIVIDNGGGESALSEAKASTLFKLRVLDDNLGIGAALNIGYAEARAAGATYAVTFDQDSNPEPGMVRALAEEFERQTEGGIKVAAVGPCFIDRRRSPPLTHPFVRLRAGAPARHYCQSGSQVIATDVLITSGCLTSFAVLDEVGGMDTSYFVDFTDMEWCFRARSRGFALMGVCRARMDHELGDGRSRRFLTLTLFEYSAIRRYYYSRNSLRMLRLPYVPLRWKVRLFLSLAARCATLPWAPRDSVKHFWREARLSFKGVWDGLHDIQGRLI